MPHLLTLNEPVRLDTPVGSGGTIVFQSASWIDDSTQPDISIDLVNGQADTVLRITIRIRDNVIALQQQFAHGGPAFNEESVPLQGAFHAPAFSITACDHGDRYQILFSHRTVHYLVKRLGGDVTQLIYRTNRNNVSPLSPILVVSTYDSMAGLISGNERATAEIRPLPLLKSADEEAAISTKPTVCHGLGPTPLPDRRDKNHLGFEYAEHSFLGDAITLKLADGTTVTAKDHMFRLPNSLHVTYGEINGLAGDFYATKEPISDGTTERQQINRFLAAFNTLAVGGSRLPKEAVDILAVLKKEVAAVNQALANHQSPSEAYSKLADETKTFEKITWGRHGIPGYLGLAQINWDHFGADARTAYNAGHEAALERAISGDLHTAYTLNAFADHFLEDSFSAGHMRTPRRELHSSVNLSADLCAKYMHDEDCAIGLSVRNPRGETWTAYGDKRALDSVNEANKNFCIEAVQASADEVYSAWQTKQKPARASYKAWDHAPTLASAAATSQTLAPLFMPQNQRRLNITDRQTWRYTNDWWFATTAALCWNSGWWKYPITIDGPRVTLTGTEKHVETYSANGEEQPRNHGDVGKGLPMDNDLAPE